MTRPTFLLDISRLISRGGETVPTGIDRVELAYADYLSRHHPDDLIFGAMHPVTGTYGVLPDALALDFVRSLVACWDGTRMERDCARQARRLRGLTLLRRKAPVRAKMVHLLVSHHHLTRPRVVRKVLRENRARLVVMIHDFIPIEFPEYSRPGEPQRHETRIRTVTHYASGVIVPSQDVADTMRGAFIRSGRPQVPVWAVPHGVHRHPPSDLPPHRSRRPYFVCLGTIEPRKNHLLLLNIWRRMVLERGVDAPKLVIIGKRGWENENIVDMLDRCATLRGHVEEHNQLPDAEVVRFLKGSRGLLFPSFVEGYGLPLIEALSLGVPAICADIPVLREVGGQAACYADPLDAVAWRELIERHAEDSSDRSGQVRGWSPFSWDESVRQALSHIV